MRLIVDEAFLYPVQIPIPPPVVIITIHQCRIVPRIRGMLAESEPGGNLTGITSLNVEMGPKRLELLHEVVPTATVVAVLINPTNPDAEIPSKDLQAAGSALGLKPPGPACACSRIHAAGLRL
jgi:hypothetical protein